MTPSARSLDHNRAPDRCANAARAAVAVHSHRDGANSTNVPPGSIPASRADRCYLLRHHHHHLVHRHRLPHFRGDARGHEDVVGVAAVDAVAGVVEVNAAEIAVVVASVVVAAGAAADAGAPRRTTARTLRRLAFELGLCDG